MAQINLNPDSHFFWPATETLDHGFAGDYAPGTCLSRDEIERGANTTIIIYYTDMSSLWDLKPNADIYHRKNKMNKTPQNEYGIYYNMTI